MWMFLLTLACTQPPEAPPAPPKPLPALSAAPSLNDITPAGLSTLLTASGPSVRVVNFWATWCKPCVAELPHLEQIASRGDVDVVLVATDLPSVGRARAPDFLRKHGVRSARSALLVADDAPAVLASVPGWGGQLPHTVVVAEDGSLVATFPGALDPSALEAVLP